MLLTAISISGATVALLITLGSGGCGPGSIPMGASRITARIDGVADTFRTIRAESYFGLRVTAESNRNRLRMNLAFGEVGTYPWSNRYLGQFQADTSANLNGFGALPGSGGFEITAHNYDIRRINGTFSFAVFDTHQNDTVRISDGAFTIYYFESD